MKTNIPCPVCGKYTFNKTADFDICKFCGWENDDFYESGGANGLSLSEYKKRYDGYIQLNPKYIWKRDGYPELSVKDECRLLHKFSANNKPLLSASVLCGCFFCGRIFKKELITDTVNDRGGKTALCPFCGVDSVLPDNEVKITEELLLNMHKTWFE